MTGTTPWYRHGWVWVLIAIPASSICFGIVMIVSATSGPTDLVRSDWYKAGLAINETLDARARADELGVTARLDDRGAGGLLLRVDQGIVAPDADLPLELWADLLHPTLAERDQRLRLDAVAHGRWAVRVDAFEGSRTLRVVAPDGSWVLEQRLRTPQPSPDRATAGTVPS